MLKVYDLMEYIEELAPAERALSFDNVGIMVGSREDTVTGVLCCLDLTINEINEAVQEGCNTVITHHPFIFNPIKRLDEDNIRGKLLSMAIRHNLNVISSHTNWDFARNGVNDALCKKLGLMDIKEDNSMEHRFGTLEREMSVQEFIEHVKESLLVSSIKAIVPDGLSDKKIKVVGVSSGSYDNEYEWIYENGIDCLVTGEIKHSEAIDLNMHKFVTVGAGHYETEVWGMDAMADILKSKFGNIKVINSRNQKSPFIFF